MRLSCETFFQAGETYVQIIVSANQCLHVSVQHLHPALEGTKACVHGRLKRGETQIQLIENVVALEDADDDSNQHSEGRNSDVKVELDVVHHTSPSSQAWV